MATPIRFEYRKGFLRLQRLGPIKFTEQSRWDDRAPHSKGLWAFPKGHFEIFYAYHKYTDLLPKSLRGYRPADPHWYLKDYDDPDSTPDKVVMKEEPDGWGGTRITPCYEDENGELQELELKPEFWEIRDKWIEQVGKKILPMREFWYSGMLYSRLEIPSGRPRRLAPSRRETDEDWTFMHTEDFVKAMKRTAGYEGRTDGDGKPIRNRYSNDHLEVFIAPGHGKIRDKL